MIYNEVDSVRDTVESIQGTYSLMEKEYNKYIDFVIARFLIEEGYEIDTIARILYDR